MSIFLLAISALLVVAIAGPFIATLLFEAPLKPAKTPRKPITPESPTSAFLERFEQQKAAYRRLRSHTRDVRKGRKALGKFDEMMDAYSLAVDYVSEDGELTFAEQRVINSLADLFDHNLKIYKNFADTIYEPDKMKQRKELADAFVSVADEFCKLAGDYTHVGRDGRKRYSELANRVAGEIQFAKEIEELRSYTKPDTDFESELG